MHSSSFIRIVNRWYQSHIGHECWYTHHNPPATQLLIFSALDASRRKRQQPRVVILSLSYRLERGWQGLLDGHVYVHPHPSFDFSSDSSCSLRWRINRDGYSNMPSAGHGLVSDSRAGWPGEFTLRSAFLIHVLTLR